MVSDNELPGGVNVLNFPALEWPPEGVSRTVDVRAIPYYAWTNREPGYMNVWLATDKELALQPPRPGPPPKPAVC